MSNIQNCSWILWKNLKSSSQWNLTNSILNSFVTNLINLSDLVGNQKIICLKFSKKWQHKCFFQILIFSNFHNCLIISIIQFNLQIFIFFQNIYWIISFPFHSLFQFTQILSINTKLSILYNPSFPVCNFIKRISQKGDVVKTYICYSRYCWFYNICGIVSST